MAPKSKRLCTCGPTTTSSEVTSTKKVLTEIQKNNGPSSSSSSSLSSPSSPKKKNDDQASMNDFDLEVKKKRVLEANNKMQMPSDFYDLLTFLKTQDDENDVKKTKNGVKRVLSDLLDIELTGIYDELLLSPDEKEQHNLTNFKLHARYYYDPPEFQTVLRVKSSPTQLHFGYFRDEPDQMPCFVGVNEPSSLDEDNRCKILPRGETLFAALVWYIDQQLKKETEDKKKKEELHLLRNRVVDWCEAKKISLTVSSTTKTMREREKSVACKCFHTAGIVLVADKAQGYREVPETNETQRKCFDAFCSDEKNDDIDNENESKSKSKSKSKKGKVMTKTKADALVQELCTLVQFANDETDYGMGLELGMNMFSHGGRALHKWARKTLTCAYQLLERPLYAEIVREHLKNRLEEPKF